MGEGRGVTRMMQPATGGKGSSKKEAKKKQTKSTVRVSGYSSRGLRRFDAVLVMPTAATEAATSNEKCVVSLGFVSPSGCQAVGFPVPGAAVNPRAGTWGLEIAKDGTVRTRHNGKQPGKVGAVDGTDGHMKVKDGDTISIEIDHQTRVRLDSVLVYFSYQWYQIFASQSKPSGSRNPKMFLTCVSLTFFLLRYLLCSWPSTACGLKPAMVGMPSSHSKKVLPLHLR